MCSRSCNTKQSLSMVYGFYSHSCFPFVYSTNRSQPPLATEYHYGKGRSLPPMARRFPEIALESTHSLSSKLSLCSSNSDSGSVAPTFLIRDSNFTDIKLGFFAHETSEQIHLRQLRMQRRWSIVVAFFASLGVSLWMVSMTILFTA